MAKFSIAVVVILFIFGFWYFSMDNPYKARFYGRYKAQKVPNDYLERVEEWKKKRKVQKKLPLMQRTIAYHYPPNKHESYSVFYGLKAKQHIAKGEKITKFMIEPAIMSYKQAPFGALCCENSATGSVAAMDIPPNAVIKADNINQHPVSCLMMGPEKKLVPFRLYRQKHGWNYGP